MTKLLISDSDSCKKHVYLLLISLIQNYEKHERFEKRITIDNFEDCSEEFGSGSGSGIMLHGGATSIKKSGSSSKNNSL